MKETNLKGHILSFQLYDTLKRQNYGDNKKISGCQKVQEKGRRDE